VLARFGEAAKPVQGDRQAPLGLGRVRIGIGRGLRGDPGVLEMAEPPQRLRGQHQRGDPDRGDRIVEVAVSHPQGAQRVIGAAERVVPQRRQRILGRFPVLVAVLGRDQLEPAGGGLPQRRVELEVARLGAGHVAGAGVVGGPGRWGNGGCHVISGVERQKSIYCSGPVPGRRRE